MTEPSKVVAAADQIATGIVDLLDSIYDESKDDAAYRDVLGAANTLAVRLTGLRDEWDR